MSFPCETAIWKALPAIRSALARALVNRKISQRKVAELLSTTEASISHYVKGKRGSSIMLGPPILKTIDRLADQIVANTITDDVLVTEICTICRKVQSSCAICLSEDSQDCESCTLVM